MDYGFTPQTVSPPAGKLLEELKAFLREAGLTYAPGIEHTVLIRDPEGRIAATASLEENIIKCVAADPRRQGEGLVSAALTVLRQTAMELGRRRLFLYTKPENRAQFTCLGFYEVARAGEAMLMEDRRRGFDTWADALRAPAGQGETGALVMNCNPMTVGHRYLAEQAAARCGRLYVLVVSEDKSALPAADRLALVEESLADLPNVTVGSTGPYLVSSATFPDYFLKDKNRSGQVWTELDIAVFCRLAERLGITRRFVGSEPFCPVTAAYNRAMAQALPRRGIQLTELPRLEREGRAVSATAVRALAAEGRWEALEPLVTPPVFRWFSQRENQRRFLERSQKAR